MVTPGLQQTAAETFPRLLDLEHQNVAVDRDWWQDSSKVANTNPMPPEFNLRTGGDFIIGSAYRIRTGDLLLEREVS